MAYLTTTCRIGSDALVVVTRKYDEDSDIRGDFFDTHCRDQEVIYKGVNVDELLNDSHLSEIELHWQNNWMAICHENRVTV